MASVKSSNGTSQKSLGSKVTASARSVPVIDRNSKSRAGAMTGAHLPPRSKSTNAKPSKPQTRTLKPTVHKTTSDTSLASNTKRGQAAATGISRRVSSAGGSPCRSVQDVVRHILSGQAKNIVVMAGAGISTASGIPDFRSPGTGLYDNLKQYRIPQPQSMFDLDYFEGNPKPFFTLSKELYPGNYRPNTVHYFLRLLHEKGLLLRVYTQNIDGLERLAGIPNQKLVEAHGSFLTASCVRCSRTHPNDEVKDAIMADKIPRCRRNNCLGLVKPDIVFFGEDLPRRFYYYMKDFPQADLLLVMGTSLEVEPFAGIVDSVKFYVPRVLFNRVAVGPFQTKRRMNDVVATGDLVSNIRHLTKMLGWSADLDTLIKDCEPDYKDPEKAGEIEKLEEQLSKLNMSDCNKQRPQREYRTLQRPAYSNNRLQESLSANKTKSEVAATKNRLKLLSAPKHYKTTDNCNLPRVGRSAARSLGFHAQKHLYRTSHESPPESEDDDSSDEESSSDDEED